MMEYIFMLTEERVTSINNENTEEFKIKIAKVYSVV